MTDHSAISLFPSRIGSRIVKASPMPESKSVGGAYNPTTDTALIPVSDTAYARTIRLHESAHAIWSRTSKLRPDDVVGQAIEDAKIHQNLQTTGSVRRDEVYTAMHDIRSAAYNMHNGVGNKAIQGVSLLRAASILRKEDSSKLGINLLTKTVSSYHEQGMELVDAILAEIKSGNIESARALASKFITGKLADEDKGNSKGNESNDSDNSEDSEGSEGEDSEGSEGEDSEGSEGEDSEGSEGEDSEGSEGEDSEGSEDSGNGKTIDSKLKELPSKGNNIPSKTTPSKASSEPSAPRLKASEEEYIPPQAINMDSYIPANTKKAETIYKLEESRVSDEDGTVTALTGDDGTCPLTAVDWSTRLREKINVPYPVMYVHTLSPNATRKVQGRGKNNYKSASQGLKIRTNRLALNSLSPSGGRLFETKNLGGTVLIDASGSMHITDEVLYEIAEKIPAGKVAYYSGISDGWSGDKTESTNEEYLDSQWSGHLVIYANAGKIRKNSGELPKRHCGNLVDYAALVWLLKQPGPRYLMTDMGFTGTNELMIRAMQLCKDAEQKKRITRFNSMAELMQMIRKR